MFLPLGFTAPYDLGIFDFLRARTVTGIEEASARSYARTLALPGGHGWFRVWWEDNALLLERELADPADAALLLSRVRHLFNLDHDPEQADMALRSHPLLAPRVAAIPGIRLPGCVDPAEILIRAMMGQQITVAAARTALNHLATLGVMSNRPHGTMTRLFPAPEQLAARGREILRGPQRRIAAIMSVAGKLADGSLAISAADTPATLAEKLLPLAGIGPWTVGYVSMRVLGASDIFLAGDAAVRNGYGLLRGDSPAQSRAIKPAELQHMGQALRPWRSYATLHLWRAAGEPH